MNYWICTSVQLCLVFGGSWAIDQGNWDRFVAFTLAAILVGIVGVLSRREKTNLQGCRTCEFNLAAARAEIERLSAEIARQAAVLDNLRGAKEEKTT